MRKRKIPSSRLPKRFSLFSPNPAIGHVATKTKYRGIFGTSTNGRRYKHIKNKTNYLFFFKYYNFSADRKIIINFFSKYAYKKILFKPRNRFYYWNYRFYSKKIFFYRHSPWLPCISEDIEWFPRVGISYDSIWNTGLIERSNWNYYPSSNCIRPYADRVVILYYEKKGLFFFWKKASKNNSKK